MPLSISNQLNKNMHCMSQFQKLSEKKSILIIYQSIRYLLLITWRMLSKCLSAGKWVGFVEFHGFVLFSRFIGNNTNVALCAQHTPSRYELVWILDQWQVPIYKVNVEQNAEIYTSGVL